MVSKTTPVLIGTLEKEIGSTKILNWDVNKIGGELIWNYEENSIKSEEIRCKMCRKKLALVSQIYCPIGLDSPFHRVLFICCCINPRCWNKSSSWAVVRCQRKDKQANQTTASSSSTQWLADEDAWGEAVDEGTATSSNPVDTELSNAIENIALQKATTSKSSENQSVEEDEVMNEVNPNVIPEVLDCPTNAPEFLRNTVKELTALGIDETPIFKPYYIEVCEEPEGSIDEEEDHAKELLSEYERTIGNPFNELGKSGGVKMEQESYEKDAPRHGDRSFFKFYKRISRLPSQIIRYCWKGEPLYISDPANEDLRKIGKCQYCGAAKVFELQLLPALVDGLKLNNNESYGHPVEFGTAVVFTCEESCWNQGDVFRLESILVQPDPDEKYFQSN